MPAGRQAQWAGRVSCREAARSPSGSWADAHAALSLADQSSLAAEDLELAGDRGLPSRPRGGLPGGAAGAAAAATGTTNHAIASQLFVADKTVDRHVSNIFTKLCPRALRPPPTPTSIGSSSRTWGEPPIRPDPHVGGFPDAPPPAAP